MTAEVLVHHPMVRTRTWTPAVERRPPIPVAMTRLSRPARARYDEAWRGLHTGYQDRPGATIRDAALLFARVMDARGLPVAQLERHADVIAAQQPALVQDYRAVASIMRRFTARAAGPEDLREALFRFRLLFDRLLRPDDSEPTPAWVPAPGRAPR